MGKIGRIACIGVPWALTLASMVCLVLIELSGWGGSKGELNDYYLMQANFTHFSTASAGDLANSTELTAALQQSYDSGRMVKLYQVHLWNYCTSDGRQPGDDTIDYCSPRRANWYFDPVAVWGLNATTTSTAATPSSTTKNAIESGIAHLKNNTEAVEDKVLGSSAKKAMDAYRKVAKWMFIAYEVSFWTTLATLVVSILAIFSRWGSFLTWIFSIASSVFTFGAVLTSTVLFAALTGALETLLHPYGIKLSMGTHALAVTWLAVVFSWAATLFWLFSVCCCSGRSNPHHKSNKGGLWAAEPKGQGYNNTGRGRGMKVEKTGGGYERVASPFLGGGHESDRVPLNDYPRSSSHSRQPSGAYEPMRHHG